MQQRFTSLAQARAYQNHMLAQAPTTDPPRIHLPPTDPAKSGGQGDGSDKDRTETASRFVATAPMAGTGVGVGLGITSSYGRVLRWGFSMDNVAAYAPGQSGGQPAGSFNPPTYHLAMAGLVTQLSTRLLLNQTLRDNFQAGSSTFLGVQRPLGPLDVGVGGGLGTDGYRSVMFAIGSHFDGAGSPWLGLFSGFDPGRIPSFGRNTVIEQPLH